VLQSSDQGLPVSSLGSICQDDKGTMWAVAQNGELSRLVDRRWQSVSREEGWSGARALCVSSDGRNGVWVGTYHAGLHHWDGRSWGVLERGDGLAGEVVRGLFLDRRGDLWLALEGGTCVQRLRAGKFQTILQPANSRPVRALVEDTHGTVWFGTVDGLLLRVEGDQLIDETARTLAVPIPIRCLLPAEDGSLWIGYAGVGVGRLSDNSFKLISAAEGLPDTYISAMAVDQGGSFWFASDRGIFQVWQRELETVANGVATEVRAITYGRDEALPSLQANYGCAPGSACSRDGRIWFPMRTGLAVIHPDRIVPRRMPPAIILERASVDGQPIPIEVGEILHLKPQHRRVDLEYTAFSFIAPELLEFRHQLDGWDNDWKDSGTDRRVGYTRLPAGQYTFRVEARSQAGEWTANESSLAFVVEPFPWQRWWFRIAVLALFTGGIIAGVRYVSFRRLRQQLVRLEQETALQRDRARIAGDLHDDLGANLTQIALLSELAQKDFGKPDEARDHIDQIFRTAKALTRSLDEIVWAVNPKNDSLDRFVAHFCTYAPEYLHSAGIRCRLDVPMDVPPLPLPADVRHHLHLAMKEALHNVAKHAEASEVKVKLSL
jgi:streptogramin lyase